MTGTKYLALDHGSKRVGIAVSDEEKKYSFSRDHLNNDANLFNSLLKLIKEESVERIILGYPLNLKSEKTIQTEAVENFQTLLEEFLRKNSLDISIERYDERFTSGIAESNIRDSGLRRKKKHEKGLIDSVSAQIILQDYIDSRKNI